MTPAQARAERAKLFREIAREHKRADRARLVTLRERFRELRRERASAIRKAQGACRLRGKVPTVAEARAMLAAARVEAKKVCAADLSTARRIRDAADRARAELRAEQKHQRSMRRIEAANRGRIAEARKASSRERRAESDDEVRGNIPPELVYLFERVKRQIKGSPHMTRTEAFLAYAHDHPDEELSALEDRTDELIRQLEARERGETMANPKKRKKKKSAPRAPSRKTEAAIGRLRAKVRNLEGKLAKRRNPRRPPGRWWESCLASVAAQRHAKDPAAVCGAAWWRKPPRERAAIVRRFERGSARSRRVAVAIAKAERNRACKSCKPKKGKRPRAEARKRNPPLVAVVYREKKKGDRRAHDYEHEFEGTLPELEMRGDDIRIRRAGSRYTTRNGWIHG